MPAQERGESASLRRAASVEAGKGTRLTLEELVDQTGVGADLIKDLEEWRLVQPGKVDGTKVYDDTDREIVKACARARPVRSGRAQPEGAAHCRRSRGGAARGRWSVRRLRSSNHNRRQEAIENLESLAAACSNLTHMLLVRDLRKLTGEE